MLHVVGTRVAESLLGHHKPLQLVLLVHGSYRRGSVCCNGGCGDCVDSCLHWCHFLAAHQGMVCQLAAVVCRRRLDLPTLALSAMSLRQIGPRAAENPAYVKYRSSFQPDRPKRQRSSHRPHGATIYLACVAALCRRGVRAWVDRHRDGPC